MVEITIRIVTSHDASTAENDIRQGIANAGYMIEDFIVEEIED